jgi:serine/threonine protein phosphatase PrpC
MLEAFAVSDKGCVRSNNEDYCLVKPELGLYILADGMGGAKAGERASRLAVDTVAEAVESSGRRERQVLLSAVEEANKKVLAAANSDPNMEGMGTTLVAALETEEGVAIASVGDSRAYILDDKGLRVITQDQTWVNDVGRPLGLDEESLRSHPMRHVLTMAIGAGTPLAINSYMVQPSPAAMLLICSDGLHGVVDRMRMEEILRGNGNGSSDSLERKCQRLIDEAKNNGGPDNISAVLMRAPGAPDLPPAKPALHDTQPI